jgi:PucR C-terminal helix-turn-helix domain/GGDEF-like domain
MATVMAGLHSRREELQRAILERVSEVASGRSIAEDPTYVRGLRSAIEAVVEYALVGVEREEGAAPVPSAAIAQAQQAAHVGVALDTVLRRYIAGYALICDFVLEETARTGSLGNGELLRRIQMKHASLLDRLIAAVTEEYSREAARARRSPEGRRADLVLQLLAGRHVEVLDLGYELDAWHLGVIATGLRAKAAVRSLASALESELLPVARTDETVWAWLGGRRRLTGSDIERLLPASWPPEVSLAIGEPGKGLEGWRLTHSQAQAALRVLLRRPQPLTRYLDVAVLASALTDDVLGRSLQAIYLSGLGERRSELRATVHAYFAEGRSTSKAARSLGVVRQTVENRLRSVEEVLGRPLHTCLPDLEVALWLDEFAEP